MPIDDKKSVERLNDLIRESEGSPIGTVSYTHLTLPTNREV